MYRLLLIYLTVFTIAACKVQGATDVSGVIDVNTTWSLAHSPYNIVDDVQVAYGATLFIDPGVVVNNGSLFIFGDLDAEGNSDNRIVFNGVSINGGNNSPDCPFAISLEFCEINGGSLYTATGFAKYGGLSIRDSVIRNTSSYIYFWYPVYNCSIERNVFYNAGGLSVGLDSGIKVYVYNNTFCKQQNGFAIKNWASYGSSELIVQYNSLLTSQSSGILDFNSL